MKLLIVELFSNIFSKSTSFSKRIMSLGILVLLTAALYVIVMSAHWLTDTSIVKDKQTVSTVVTNKYLLPATDNLPEVRKLWVLIKGSDVYVLADENLFADVVIGDHVAATYGTGIISGELRVTKIRKE